MSCVHKFVLCVLFECAFAMDGTSIFVCDRDVLLVLGVHSSQIVSFCAQLLAYGLYSRYHTGRHADKFNRRIGLVFLTVLSLWCFL